MGVDGEVGGQGLRIWVIWIFSFPSSKRPHTQTSASTTPQPARLSSLLKCRTRVILVSKRRKAALPSSRRTLTWKPGRGRKKKEELGIKEAPGGLGGSRRPRKPRVWVPSRTWAKGTDRTPLGGNSRRTSSCSHPCPLPLAPASVAAEGTSLRSSVR